MSKFYDEALLPDELRRSFDVYDRIRELGIPMGSFSEDVVSLEGAGIAGTVVHESGLVYLSGTTAGTYPMNDDEDRIAHGFEAAQEAADVLIRRLHWTLSCGGEGDLNDVLYTVKALGMVVSPGGGASGAAPFVTNGFSFQMALGLWRASERLRRGRRRCRRIRGNPRQERDGRVRRQVLHRTGDYRSGPARAGAGDYPEQGLGLSPAARDAGQSEVSEEFLTTHSSMRALTLKDAHPRSGWRSNPGRCND